jgi:uncharacterized membrane protein/Tfp pilus assembly protein PilF
MKKSKKKIQQRSDGAAPERDPAVELHGPDAKSSPGPGFANSASTWLASLPFVLHWIFLFLVTPTLIFLAVCTPPFQSPDELAHFERSYQISNGGLFGGSGGNVDRGIDEAISPYSQLPFNATARVTAADKSAAGSANWTGQTVYHDFFNTAQYPPVGYLPQALGVALGRIAGLSVVHTLILARLINGAAAIIISVFALYCCRRGKLLMFALLLMPMTISLFASCSQDASLISLTALAFALVSRQISEGVPLSLRITFVLAAALLIVVSGRPPYLPLLIVLFIPGILPAWEKKPAWFSGVSLAALVAVLTILWWMLSSSSYAATRPITDGVNNATAGPKLQLLNMFQHPGVIAAIVSDFDYRSLAQGFIGNLGWIDTLMPRPYYLIFGLVLLVAAAGEMIYRGRFRAKVAAVPFIAAISAVAGVFLSLYLIWSPVGSHIVWCVQGRYLIPPALAGCIGLPYFARSDRGYQLATVAVVLCQIITFFYLPKVIFERYYLMSNTPNFIKERLYFADALQSHGNPDEAAQEYRQVIAADPNNYIAHNGLGGVLANKQLTQEALKEFRLSLTVKPDQSVAHYQIGRILEEANQFPAAETEFAQAVRYDPANGHIHNALGVVLFQLGDREKAIEQFDEALRINPADADTKENLAIIQSQMKKK